MTRRAAGLTAAAIALLAQLGASLATPAPLPWNRAPLLPLSKLLLWNASASVPRGLYWLRPVGSLHIGELVTAMPPPPLAKFFAARGYLPLGVPLLKHIGALPGQVVCRANDVVTIDGHVAAMARDRDRLGRLLPTWTGCRRLRAGEVFLLNANIPDSLDGRYFGALPTTAITGRAQPLWTFQEH